MLRPDGVYDAETCCENGYILRDYWDADWDKSKCPEKEIELWQVIKELPYDNPFE